MALAPGERSVAIASPPQLGAAAASKGKKKKEEQNRASQLGVKGARPGLAQRARACRPAASSLGRDREGRDGACVRAGRPKSLTDKSRKLSRAGRTGRPHTRREGATGSPLLLL
jgi:hypothetical protein